MSISKQQYLIRSQAETQTGKLVHDIIHTKVMVCQSFCYGDSKRGRLGDEQYVIMGLSSNVYSTLYGPREGWRQLCVMRIVLMENSASKLGGGLISKIFVVF